MTEGKGSEAMGETIRVDGTTETRRSEVAEGGGSGGVETDSEKRPVDAPHESHFVPALQFMLPNSQPAPAAGAEGAGHESVAGAVGGDLWPFTPSGRPPTATPALRCGATPAS
jgi:hypothetical protein